MNQNKDKDLILWDNLKDGDVNALGDLYDMYVDDLFHYGLQFSDDRGRIMDCIHDLFLNLYKYRKKLANTDNIKYYLLRCLKNQILKHPKNKIIFLDDDLSFNVQTASFEDKIIINEFYNEQVIKLSNAINLLSKTQKKGLFLRYTQEYTYEEIANIMKVSVQTSRTIVYRAIKVLRKNLTLLIITLFQILS